MCFAIDSHPPITPIAGAAVDGRSFELAARDGNHFLAFRADAPEPSGAGIIVLPDVRGLFPYYEELALRFAEVGVDAIAIDYFGRTAGTSHRGDDFESRPHVEQTTWGDLQADAAAAADELRRTRGISSLFSIGFCFGGRVSFLLSTLEELRMSGVIGFYGWPVGSRTNDTPAPADVAADVTAPILGLFGGADKGIPASDVLAYEAALRTADVEHRLVTYEDAPHSFFDRKQDRYQADSDAAWAEVRRFIEAHTA